MRAAPAPAWGCRPTTAFVFCENTPTKRKRFAHPNPRKTSNFLYRNKELPLAILARFACVCNPKEIGAAAAISYKVKNNALRHINSPYLQLRVDCFQQPTLRHRCVVHLNLEGDRSACAGGTCVPLHPRI